MHPHASFPHRLALLAGLLACTLGSTAQAFSGMNQDTKAVTYGCDAGEDDPPYWFIVDVGAVMRERYSQRASRVAPSGDLARTGGSVTMGRLPPLHAKASAAPLVPGGCAFSGASASRTAGFWDELVVSAGDLPAGTPVTYTATIDLPVELKQTGESCATPPFFLGTLELNLTQVQWEQSGVYSGTHQMTVSATTAVGETLPLYFGVMAVAQAYRRATDIGYCADTSIRLLDTARVKLTADVPGANMVSVNGVRYGR